MKICVFSFGCKVNQYDAQYAINQLKSAGHQVITKLIKDADVYFIYTCGVTQTAENKAKQLLRKIHRENPDAGIAVMGCLAQLYPEEMLAFDNVFMVLGNEDRVNLLKYFYDYIADKKSIQNKTIEMKKCYEETPIDNYYGRTRAYIKIQEGCRQFCTYCIIPYARGVYKSRKIEDIKMEAQRLANQGFKEIVITGIHITAYGIDFGKQNLADVVGVLNDIEGIKRIRLGSIDPQFVDDDMLKQLSLYDKLCPHFHLSLQSGCDNTLELMNRKYTTQQYYEIVKKLRRYYNNPSITTDIIVGFPQETEQDFEQTVEFVKNIEFNKIHVFPYSSRKGTKASEFSGHIKQEIKHQRAKILTKIAKEKAEVANSKYIGTVKEVLIEKIKENKAMGHTREYTFVEFDNKNCVNNEIINVCIKGINKNGLVGEIYEV